MVDACTLQNYIQCALDAVLNAPVKAEYKTFVYNGTGTFYTDPIPVDGYNAVSLLISPPTGTNITGDIHVQGSNVASGFVDLADPNAVTTGISVRKNVDVTVGTSWVRVQLTNLAGTPDPNQIWSIIVTPYVSPGQTRVAANIVVNTLSAIQVNTGALDVSDVCTIGASGALEALGTGSAKASLSADGLDLYNSLGTQTGHLGDDGSGWLGSASVLAWNTSGVVSLNGSAVMPGTLPGSATDFGNVPIIGGLTITNNSPSGGYVAWSSFTLTYQGTSYTVTAGNSNQKFIYWNKATSTTVLQASNTAPSQAADQFIVIFNESGTGVLSVFSNIVYADYISVGTLAAIQANIGACNISDVLTIGTNGGIYQGTGSFAAPNTGLKIFNSGGIGALATYDGGVLQVELDTTGALVAGAGNVQLDSTGIWCPMTSSRGTSNGFLFKTGGTVVGGLYGSPESLSSNVVGQSLETQAIAGNNSVINVNAFCPSGYTSTVTLSANNGSASAELVTKSGTSQSVAANIAGAQALLVDGTGVTIGGALINSSDLDLKSGTGHFHLIDTASGEDDYLAVGSGLAVYLSGTETFALSNNGGFYLKTGSSPGAAAGFGCLYVDASGHLHYKDPSGTDTPLAN